MTFVHLPLTTTTADSYTVDNIALLGLVAKASSLVGSGGARRSVDGIQLPVLPASHSKEKSEEVRLLLPPELL